MALSTQPYKGARDFYPQDKRLQKWLFERMRKTVESFGYQEYDAPLLEPLELYQAKSGDELVNEQTYVFEDRGGRKVVVRPEMTPSVSRLVAGRRQEFSYPLRLYNIGSRWRYERPQRGRNREFFQCDVDIFGVEGPEADAEVIQVADTILKNFGAKEGTYDININSRVAMVSALEGIGMSENELKEAYKLIDKMPKMDEKDFDKLIADALGEEKAKTLREVLSNEHPPENVKKILDILKAAGVASAKYEPSVVRGLEYYTDIVFEVFDTSPKNARAMFGGGRYDGLVGMFGVEPVPTVGFAMGDVTLLNFLETHELLPELKPETDAAVLLVGDVYEAAQPLISDLRSKANIAVDMTDRKIDKKIQSAEKAGVNKVIFIGEDEIKSGQVKVKDLTSGDEQTVKPSEFNAS